MTTQPEGRLFRLSPDESPLAPDTTPPPAQTPAGEAGGKPAAEDPNEGDDTGGK